MNRRTNPVTALDIALLAALMLGGLMDPATAAIIAALEADRLRDQRRAH